MHKENKVSDNQHNQPIQYDNLPWYVNEEKSVFVDIDFKQEDKDVDTYQKTNDAALFEKIYKIRIPTLQIWARRYCYLADSNDDMYGDFCLAFTKAVFTYKKGQGTFNTYLWRLLQNCKNNLYIGSRAKKRLPEGCDPNSMGKHMLSLDYSYDSKDGSGNTLKDVLANKMSVEDGALKNMIMDETLKTMSNQNEFISSFLKKLSNGHTIASLLKEYKTRRGKIKISRVWVRRLNGRRGQTKVVSDLIRNNTSIKDNFFVLDYFVKTPNKLHYTIEMKKTKEADLVMKTIRKLKKDKKGLMEKIAE